MEIMRTLPDNCIDLTVTSPPYDNLRTYNGFSFDFESVAKELYRITKDGGVVVWVVGDATVNGSETGTSFRQALYFKDIGFNLHDTMIWQKPNYAPMYPSVKRYDLNFEYMFVLSKGQPKTWNPIKDKVKTESSKQRAKYKTSFANSDGTRYRRDSIDNGSDFSKRNTIWIIPNGQIRGLDHPAPFPEQLVSDHIISWSNPGDLVFDPFLGSGTTAKMGLLNGRNYLGCDVSEEYCDIARRRVEQAQSQQSLFKGGD